MPIDINYEFIALLCKTIRILIAAGALFGGITALNRGALENCVTRRVKSPHREKKWRRLQHAFEPDTLQLQI